MLLTFSYRIYPTKKQCKRLDFHLDSCRWLYNYLLAQRKSNHDTFYTQKASLPCLKSKYQELNNIHSQVLQDVVIRINKTFNQFFQRIKTGENPGYPRFKGVGRYNSFTFPQLPKGCTIKDDFLRLSKVGAIKIVIHRKLHGRLKTCTIKKSSTGKWYANFVCEVENFLCKKPNGTSTGIDVGLRSFVTFSSGKNIANPRFFRTDEKALAKAQRKLSKIAKGIPERAKYRKPISRIYERISFRRKDFVHQLSTRIIRNFYFIAIEDLSVNRMVQNRYLAKSISDAAWSMFFTFLLYKAANAGRVLVKVNPAYTSQTCSGCGHRQKMPLSERLYSCPCCQLNLDRDHNAALNILKIGMGLHTVGSQSLEVPTLQ